MEPAAIHYKFVRDSIEELKKNLQEEIEGKDTKMNAKVNDIVAKHLVLPGIIGPKENFKTLIEYSAGNKIPKLVGDVSKMGYEFTKMKAQVTKDGEMIEKLESMDRTLAARIKINFEKFETKTGGIDEEASATKDDLQLQITRAKGIMKATEKQLMDRMNKEKELTLNQIEQTANTINETIKQNGDDAKKERKDLQGQIDQGAKRQKRTDAAMKKQDG